MTVENVFFDNYTNWYSRRTGIISPYKRKEYNPVMSIVFGRTTTQHNECELKTNKF